jgi:hypothetical protein
MVAKGCHLIGTVCIESYMTWDCSIWSIRVVSEASLSIQRRRLWVCDFEAIG